MNRICFKFIHKTDKCLLNRSETLCIHCCCVIICKWVQDLSLYVWLTLQHQTQRCCSNSSIHPTRICCVLQPLVNSTGDVQHYAKRLVVQNNVSILNFPTIPTKISCTSSFLYSERAVSHKKLTLPKSST